MNQFMMTMDEEAQDRLSWLSIELDRTKGEVFSDALTLLQLATKADKILLKTGDQYTEVHLNKGKNT